MADKEEVPENMPPRKKLKFKSVKEIIARDEFRTDPDLGFNGGGHSALEGYYLNPSHVDYLKSFGPRLEESIGLLSSEKKDENLSTILINREDWNFELGFCISLIGISIGIIDMHILARDEEAEEALLKHPIFTAEHPVLADTSAESQSCGGIESFLMALIKNLEEQMVCITDLIRFLEVDGSTKDEMGLLIMRLWDLLENESKRIIPFLLCETGSR